MMSTAMASTPDIRDADWVAGRLDDGDTVTAIAEAAGVSRQTASTWVKRHGLAVPHKALPRPPSEQMAADYERVGSIRPLATEYGISSAVMRTWLFEAGVDLKTRGRPRTVDVDVDQAARLRNEGRTIAEIATELDVPYETLRRRLED